MKRSVLLAPDAPAGIAPAAPKPGAPVAPVKPAPGAPAAPVPSPSPSPAPEPAGEPDPFEPPKKETPAAAPAKPSDKPADGKVVSVDFDKLAPKELRERVKQLNTEKEQWDKAKKDMESKIAQFEARGKDTSALTERLSQIEKERDAALADLRAARQEASPEFKEKFDKPFNQAAERARKQVLELTVTVDPESGETRPATWNDFAALYSLPVGKAIEQAEAMFGKSAQFVLGLREKLLDLDTARATALEEEKAQFKERTAREIADQTLKRENVGKLWVGTNKRLAESVADYKVDTTDAEAADARKHALSVFDAQINAADHDDFIQKKVLKDAHVRQRVGAYAVQKIQIARLKAEKEALQKQVDELKGTAPGGTKRAGGDAAKEGEEQDDWATGLKKAVTG